MTFIHHSKVL